MPPVCDVRACINNTRLHYNISSYQLSPWSCACGRLVRQYWASDCVTKTRHCRSYIIIIIWNRLVDQCTPVLVDLVAGRTCKDHGYRLLWFLYIFFSLIFFTPTAARRQPWRLYVPPVDVIGSKNRSLEDVPPRYRWECSSWWTRYPKRSDSFPRAESVNTHDIVINIFTTVFLQVKPVLLLMFSALAMMLFDRLQAKNANALQKNV